MDEEHIVYSGGVNLSCGRVQSIDTGSGSRKWGFALVTSARQHLKARSTSEDLYYDEAREYISSRQIKDDAGSSDQAGGMKECIVALQNLNPRLPIDWFY